MIANLQGVKPRNPSLCPPAFEGGVGGLGQGKRERGRRHEGKSASGSIFDVDRNRTPCYLVACQTTTKNHNGQITALFQFLLPNRRQSRKEANLEEGCKASGCRPGVGEGG